MDKLRKDSHIEVGMRIKLIDMLNDPNPIPKGSEGTVESVSDLGAMGQVVGVKWDNGRTLNVIPGVDNYEILKTVNRDGMFREGEVSVPKNKQSKSSKKFSKNFKSSMGRSGKGLKLESDIKKVMSVKNIAKKHGISVKEIEKEIKVGAKIELEHTDDEKTAIKIATHHVEEHHDYYSNEKHGLISNEDELEEEYAGSFVGPLGGQPIKRSVYGESYTLKMKDLMEISTTNTAKLRDDASFDGSAWVGDKDNDGWNFNDKPTFHEDGEIVDILAKMDINWKDEDLTVVTKESVMESVSEVIGEEKVLIDEGIIDKISDIITNVKGFVKNQRESIQKLYELKRKVNSAYKEGRIPKEKYQEYNKEISSKSKVLIVNIIKVVGPASIPTGLIIRTLILALGKTPIGKRMGMDKLDKLLSPKELDIKIDDLNLDFGVEKLTSNDINEPKKPESDEEEEVTTETTTFGSVMGVNGMPVGKTFASTGESSSAGKKPTWAGGKIVQSIPNEGVLMPESFTLAEINKIKYMEGGKYVKLKNKCVKYRNQPFCSAGDADKPVILSDTTSDNIDEVSRKTGLTKEEIFEALLVSR